MDKPNLKSKLTSRALEIPGLEFALSLLVAPLWFLDNAHIVITDNGIAIRCF